MSTQGSDGTTGVYLDGIPLEEHDAEAVLRIRDLYEKDVIPRHDYMKYLRRLKARAESSG